MQEITPENAQSWRDLTDQLTYEQIAELEERERDPGRLARAMGNPEYWHSPEDLLHAARCHAADNLAVSITVHEWADPDTPDAFRQFDIAFRKIGDGVEVQTAGIQNLDGSVGEFAIRLHGCHPDDDLTPKTCRRLAVALIAAADEIDGLAAR